MSQSFTGYDGGLVWFLDNREMQRLAQSALGRRPLQRSRSPFPLASPSLGYSITLVRGKNSGAKGCPTHVGCSQTGADYRSDFRPAMSETR